jgi:hypothetical protein
VLAKVHSPPWAPQAGQGCALVALEGAVGEVEAELLPYAVNFQDTKE